jgi:hypothetical protein
MVEREASGAERERHYEHALKEAKQVLAMQQEMTEEKICALQRRYDTLKRINWALMQKQTHSSSSI